MKKIIIAYSIQNGGDGSAYPQWFLSLEDAKLDQELAQDGWGESCADTVETFEGSDIHEEAKNMEFCCTKCYCDIDITIWRANKGLCNKCKEKEENEK